MLGVTIIGVGLALISYKQNRVAAAPVVAAVAASTESEEGEIEDDEL